MRRARAAATLALLLAVVAGCGAAPTPSPTPSPSPSPSPTPSPTPSPSPSASPTPSPTPSPSPTPIAAGRPTRVSIPSLRIDLPVVNPPEGSTFPLCDVAEYFMPPAFQHPGAGGVTYIYAHAREGMFLPILRLSIRDAKRLVGRDVDVWTANDWRYRYHVSAVRRHQKTLDWAFELPPNSLVLQTSETPYRTGTKVMLVAEQVGDPVRVERAEARPKPEPRRCDG